MVKKKKGKDAVEEVGNKNRNQLKHPAKQNVDLLLPMMVTAMGISVVRVKLHNGWCAENMKLLNSFERIM